MTCSSDTAVLASSAWQDDDEDDEALAKLSTEMDDKEGRRREITESLMVRNNLNGKKDGIFQKSESCSQQY
jgi:hypothetical protein